MGTIWNSPTVKDVLRNKGREFWLDDNAEYFYSDLDRVKQPDYVPSVCLQNFCHFFLHYLI